MLFEKGVIDPKAAHYSYRCSALFLQVLLLLLSADCYVRSTQSLVRWSFGYVQGNTTCVLFFELL